MLVRILILLLLLSLLVVSYIEQETPKSVGQSYIEQKTK
jgi:hypothetical protein